ncbi:uncharacterized protein F4822DRAFT_262472 [Hypoxylon trugodes]|uniref:uncharacterized protein n=1 Tax=Hypoxylon trugodes TaxID=326681 RepID=UPI0021946866|nr:uncharacterized protein F4822DRAFT_262472 [Hypoxylon trugodes]KAI1388929.1 hypothetical protein F4822DRAFT_262472 [Hypoxylon trugodes]
MDDLPSSPDPLGDEPPSSAQSFARHTKDNTITQHDLSALSLPKTTYNSRRTSPTRTISPRKRTFELDVGNELSPQKILVTVEAEEAEALKRGINRRLFQQQPTSSPTRGRRPRETVTTATIPLNDEIENESTPRRPGRPRRRTSNGTPMPKGKKRAGTPMKESRQTRRKGGLDSDASVFDDTPAGTDENAPTPKAQTKVRKTPKALSTTQVVLSSQISTATKRKRGRPRKAPIEDVTILADADDVLTSDAVNHDIAHPSRENPRIFPPSAPISNPNSSRYESSRRFYADDEEDNTEAFIGELARDGDRTPTQDNISNLHEQENTRLDPELPARSHNEGRLDDDDMDVGNDYPPLMENHSDVGSEFDDFDNVPHSGQDTLAHASDFSMIAVESLPSFQANRSAFPSDPQEIGDETNQIINETIESLRNSIQADAAKDQSSRHDLPPEENRSGIQGSSFFNQSPRRPSKSPRRQKQLPLSRQVFNGKAPHVDDSFSNIADTILHATTPGRLPMKPTSGMEQYEKSGAYDDSFSEIPEEVLEAATPKPKSRVGMPRERDDAEVSAPQDQPNSVNRQTGSNFGSSRLPTPDDTSSSNAGSKKAPEEDAGPSSRPQADAVSTSNSAVQSSPPVMNRPRAMDFGPSLLDQEMNNTPELQQSSPQLPPSAKEIVEPAKSLEPPPNVRPSLSPIVRAGRYLQDVVSDRSSPRVREGSLGSPFRGAANDPSRSLQDTSNPSSMPESPTRPNYNISGQFAARNLFNFNPTVNQSMRSNISRSQPPPQGEVLGNVSDPFGLDIQETRNEALRKDTHDTSYRELQRDTAFAQSAASSTRVMPPNEDEMSWMADGNQQEAEHRADPQYMRSQNSSIYATRGSNGSHAAISAANAAYNEVDMEGDQDLRDRREPEEDYGDDYTGGGIDFEDDDIWDVEASRPTPRRPRPEREPEPERRASQLYDPPRRNKIPSPWRRTSRRLIYRQEIASPSQIEIEENPQSEPDEQVPRSRSGPRRSDAQSIVRREQPELRVTEERERTPSEPEQYEQYEQFEQQSPSPPPYLEPEFSPEPEQELQQEPEREPEQEPEPEPELESEIEEPIAEQAPGQGPAEAVEASEYSMLIRPTEDTPATQKKPTPAKTQLFGSFNLMSFFSSPATLPTKVPEAGPATKIRETEKTAQPAYQKPVPREPEPEPKPQPQPQPHKEPPKSLWSTGFFSSIPQKQVQPSSERQTDQSSPAPPSQSNETVADTYEATSPSHAPSPTPSPSPAPDPSLSPKPAPAPSLSPELSHPPPEPSPAPSQTPEPMSPPSPQPSTPEQQVYQPIEQKRNFTPRPGQSGSSLFRTGPSPSRVERNYSDDFLLPPSDEQQESSLLTDGTEYERLPPREKPSRWDRTLSPSKSSFRSPLKPTTPGRVVTFKPSGLSPVTQNEDQPESQAYSRDDNRGVLSQRPQLPSLNKGKGVVRRNSLLSRPPMRNSAVYNPSPAATNENNFMATILDTSPEPQPEPEPPVFAPAPAPAPLSIATTNPSAAATVSAPTSNTPLSQTEWTRAHWVRLDELLQICRQNPRAFKRRVPLPPRSERRSLTTLLGKEVSTPSHPESLILDRGHLDIIDAFKLEVGGWEEHDLARRLFALMVGEERRRLGKVPQRDREHEDENRDRVQTGYWGDEIERAGESQTRREKEKEERIKRREERRREKERQRREERIFT